MEAKFAHELTFKEMHESKVPVINTQGVMVGGPDRKMIDDWSKWVAWQKAVQKASNAPGLVPPHVMAYFQATKHLSHPPQEGDNNIMQDAPLDPALIPVARAFTPPRFTWSYTSMQEFLTCPAAWAAKRYFKTAKDVETEAMIWGTRVHETAEHYMKRAVGQPYDEKRIDPACLLVVQKYCDFFIASGAELFIEHEMCFTKDLKPCGWRDWDTVWMRGKGDVLALKGEKILISDWKTGKIKNDFLQLKLFAVFTALQPQFKDAQEFDPRFIYVKEPDPAKAVVKLDKPIKRSELLAELKKILAIVGQMETSWQNENFPCTKNGLCRQYCANLACPHNGRR